MPHFTRMLGQEVPGRHSVGTWYEPRIVVCTLALIKMYSRTSSTGTIHIHFLSTARQVHTIRVLFAP